MITLLSPLWGGEGAPRAFLLALLILLGATLTGCRHPIVHAPERHSVHIPALLPLHPAWAEIKALDAQLAKLPTLPAPPSIRPTPLPATFTPPGGLPPNLIASQEKLVHDDAAHYIAQLESALDLRARELVNSKQRAEEQIAAAKYKVALEKKETELRNANEAEAKEVRKDVNRLDYRNQALDSQIRVYSTSGLNARRMIDDAKQQQAIVNQQIDANNARIDALLHADFRGLAEAALQSYRKQLDAATAAGIQQFTREQAAHDQQELEQATQRLNTLPSAIPKLADPAGDWNSPRAVPLVLPPMPSLASDYSQAQGSVAVGQSHLRDQLLSERAHLLSVIQEDTRKAVVQIARKQGWILVPEGQANDWTNAVKSALQSQWRR